jgi:hypothetical protein
MDKRYLRKQSAGLKKERQEDHGSIRTNEFNGIGTII